MGAFILTPARVALAICAALVGGIPAFFGTHEDRSLALGLPVIALGLGVLLKRIDRTQPLLADVASAVLLICPGLAAHGWLRLRALDAMAWYRADLAVIGVLDQAGSSGAGAGLLLGGAVSLAALRGPQAGPLIGAIVAAGTWLGAGGLSVALLAVSMDPLPPVALLLGVSLTAEGGVGAAWGAVLAIAGARGIPTNTPTRTGRALIGATLGAVLCAAATAPVHMLAEQLNLSNPQQNLPAVRPGPRISGRTIQTALGTLTDDLSGALATRGLAQTPNRAWLPTPYPNSAWASGVRLAAVVALPPDAPRTALDAAARVLWDHRVSLLALPGRAEGLPPGIVDDLLGWPTAELLLDAPPVEAAWLDLQADGTIAGLPALAEQTPVCVLRSSADVTVSLVTRTVLDLTRPADLRPRCLAVAWPPERCHSHGSGDPHCPALPSVSSP